MNVIVTRHGEEVAKALLDRIPTRPLDYKAIFRRGFNMQGIVTYWNKGSDNMRTTRILAAEEVNFETNHHFFIFVFIFFTCLWFQDVPGHLDRCV